MKKLLSIFFCMQAVLPVSGQPVHKEPLVKKNTIALLGTYHFNNPNQDQFNVNSDNILSEKRQKEIERVAATLAIYKPTRIALEFNASDTAMDARYQRYLKGRHTLNNSELEQIGFRLAKMLGHPHVYPVDAPDIQLDFDPGELAAEYGHLLEQLGKTGDSVMAEINSWVKNHTVGQVLARLNAPEMDRLNVELYYKYILPIGKAGKQPGPEAVTRWYKRNLLILHHIRKLTEGKSNERILVIFGQGHTAMLKQFLPYTPEFELVNIQPYLPVN